MADIQNVVITSTQIVTQPKPHTTYTIQISTPIRTWTVSRRYNDFVALHAELKSSTSKEPPAALPPKHKWTITRSVYDEKIIRERRVLLEAYLRAILTTKDDRWRKAYTFLDFLAVPSNTRRGSGSANNPGTGSSLGESSSSSSSVPPPPSTFTPQSWLSESTNLQSLLRLTRSALLKRDALASMADASGSRSSGIEAKRLLKEASTRLDGLEGILGGLKVGDGEKRRREEVVDNLKVERDNLRRMIDAGVRTNRDPSTTSNYSAATGSTMPGGNSALFGAMPHAQTQPGRVFGKRQPPEETAETRPLEDRQLLQLQQSKMDGQDQQLGELSKVLLRQRKMGEEIHQEIGEQTDMLEDIDQEVGKVGGKLQRAKRDMNKLN